LAILAGAGTVRIIPRFEGYQEWPTVFFWDDGPS